MGNRPWAAIWARCSGLVFWARSPPCTLGCRVLTRPSSISGKPVNSETSLIASPASRSSLAVPPVERISTLYLASSFENSMMPVLSETLMSARVIFAMGSTPLSLGKIHLLKEVLLECRCAGEGDDPDRLGQSLHLRDPPRCAKRPGHPGQR